MYKEIKKMIDYSEGGITSKVVNRNDTGDVTLFCMAKDTSISTHTSTKSGYVYVIEGGGTFFLEGVEVKMSPGVMIFMDANAKHSLVADKDTSFVLILVKNSFSLENVGKFEIK